MYFWKLSGKIDSTDLSLGQMSSIIFTVKSLKLYINYNEEEEVMFRTEEDFFFVVKNVGFFFFSLRSFLMSPHG